MTVWKALIVIVTANAVPLAVGLIFRGRLEYPVDAGVTLGDRKRLFGSAKTLSGLLGALMSAAVVAFLVGLAWWWGVFAGAACMVGDLLSSFTKRRLGRPPHSNVPGLDQIPESLLAVLVLRAPLELTWTAMTAVVILFSAIDLGGVAVLNMLGLKQPSRQASGEGGNDRS